MLAWLAACCLASALAAFDGLRARDRRLAAGEAGLPDLAARTGLTDRRGLLAVPGVRERPDGALRFDPRYLDRLPVHPFGNAFDSYAGNGLCVAVAIGALGCGLGPADHPAASGVAGGLLGLALLYQLMGRLWSAAVWLELRAPPARD